MIRRLTTVLLVCCLLSCRTQPPPVTQSPLPSPEIPLEIYHPSADAVVYKIDTTRSRADIVVRRGGALARFGHDHTVSATSIEGFALSGTKDFKKSRADLRLALNSLVVDDPIIRNRFALDTRPTEQDIRKTTENMQGKVLQTDVWPEVLLNIAISGGTREAPEALLTVHLHGTEHQLPITFSLEGSGTEQLHATGSFRLQQSDYGIEPFTILGGALQVLDPVEVTFDLVAYRVDSPNAAPSSH